MAGDQEKLLELPRKEAIDLGRALDFHILLRAIDQTMPEGSILCLEGGTTAPAVAAFLRDREADDPRELVADADEDAVAFHLPLVDGNLGELRALAEDFIAPEIAFHLAVYRDDEVLLWAHEAGGGTLLLARSLPDATVDAMRSALGATLRPHRPRGFFALLRSRHK
jgi:hypothetical protein